MVWFSVVQYLPCQRKRSAKKCLPPEQKLSKIIHTRVTLFVSRLSSEIIKARFHTLNKGLPKTTQRNKTFYLSGKIDIFIQGLIRKLSVKFSTCKNRLPQSTKRNKEFCWVVRWVYCFKIRSRNIKLDLVKVKRVPEINSKKKSILNTG